MTHSVWVQNSQNLYIYYFLFNLTLKLDNKRDIVAIFSNYWKKLIKLKIWERHYNLGERLWWENYMKNNNLLEKLHEK